MIEAYLIGLTVFAFIYGFQSPYGSKPDGHRAIITVLGWPIIVIIAAGEAARMFSTKRVAEDVSRGMEP